MGQADGVGPLDASIGFTLKLVASSLRTAMDQALQPMDLSVPQYACLEQLGQDPGLSNAELARRVFVTRQSMNLVLRGLQERGLLRRPDVVDHGRARPTELTARGRRTWHAASAAVRAVEDAMLADLSNAEQRRLLRDLHRCARSVTEFVPD